MRGLRAGLVWPLDYPHPDGEFFGYERYGFFNGDDDAEEMYTPGARTILNCATMIATARLTHVGKRVPSKRRCVEMDGELTLDESAGWLTALYSACKTRWRYRVPDDQVGRAACAPMLAFENDFLAFARPLNEAALIAQDEYS